MAALDFDGCVRRLGPPGAPAAFEPAPRRRAIFDAPLSISRGEHDFGANGASGSGPFRRVEGRYVGPGAKKTRGRAGNSESKVSRWDSLSAPEFLCPSSRARVWQPRRCASNGSFPFQSGHEYLGISEPSSRTIVSLSISFIWFCSVSYAALPNRMACVPIYTK